MVGTRLYFLAAFLATAAAVMPGCSRGRESARPSGPLSLSPTALQLSPAFRGTWSGTFRITACTGQRHCVQSIGTTAPVTLRLEQNGDHVSGVLRAGSVTMDVAGTVGAGDELTLRGMAPSTSGHAPKIRLTRFSGQWSPTHGITGSFEYVMVFPETADIGVLSSRVQVTAGQIISTSPGPADEGASFAGRWLGRFAVRNCTTVGWADCWPQERGREYGFDLTLAQSGTSVSGTLALLGTVPVTGTVSGDRLFLEGSLTTDESGGRNELRLTHWHVRRDHVGRLTGSFGYVRETIWQLNRPNYESRYDLELLSVILSP